MIWVLIALGFIAVVACRIGDHSRIDDQRFVAEQRRRWKNHKPYYRSLATRFLDRITKS